MQGKLHVWRCLLTVLNFLQSWCFPVLHLQDFFGWTNYLIVAGLEADLENVLRFLSTPFSMPGN